MFKPHLRQFVAVCLFDFAIVCGMTVSPFFIFHHLGGGAPMSGVIAGAQWALYALACLISAPYVTRAKNGLIWALIGGAGFTVLFPLSVLFKNPYYFGAMTTAAMACTGLFWPAQQAWIGAIPDPHLRRRRMAQYNVSWTIGLTLAPLVTGWAYDAFGYPLPFVILFATAAGALALTASLPHEKKHFGAATQELRDVHAKHDQACESHLYATWFSLLIGCALISAMAAVFTKRMEELVEAGQLVMWSNTGPPLTREAIWYFSWLAFVLYASRATASLIMGFSHAWQHKFSLLVAFQIAAGVAFWVLAHTQSLIVMAACCLAIGLTTGVCFFASQTYSVVAPEHKHRRLAVHESMVGIGSFAGAIGFGLLAGRFGTPWPFAYTPILVAVGLFAQTLLLGYGHKRQRRLLAGECEG